MRRNGLSICRPKIASVYEPHPSEKKAEKSLGIRGSTSSSQMASRKMCRWGIPSDHIVKYGAIEVGRDTIGLHEISGQVRHVADVDDMSCIGGDFRRVGIWMRQYRAYLTGVMASPRCKPVSSADALWSTTSPSVNGCPRISQFTTRY